MTEKQKEELYFPDYSNSILNFSCSIQKYYGIRPEYKSLPVVDEILSQKFKHVVVILLSGFGVDILNNHLSQMDFLRRHLLAEYSSVCPSTNAASVTSLLTGLSPIEHGKPGDNDDNINSEQKIIQETIIDQINSTKRAKAYEVLPAKNPELKNLDKWCAEIKKICKKGEKNFIYAYYENPEEIMKIDGTNASSVKKIVDDINAHLALLCEELKETVIFITADHGQTDVQNFYLEDYPEITKMLEKPLCLESRAASFFVKPEYKDEFPEVFNKHFGDDYALFTKQEVLDKAIFGSGLPNANITEIGDFVAIAGTSKALLWNKDCKSFRSNYAGLTKQEMNIPLIWYENKPKKAAIITYYTLVALIVAFLFYITFV